eukprot:UN22094
MRLVDYVKICSKRNVVRPVNLFSNSLRNFSMYRTTMLNIFNSLSDSEHFILRQ